MTSAAAGLPRYAPSGFFRLTTIPLLLGGAVVGCAAAWLYAALCRWIPFIYVNALLCLGFGVVLGAMGVFAVHAGHCRNRLLAILFALPLGLAPVAASHYWNYRSTIAEVAEEFSDLTPTEISAQLPIEKYLEMRQQSGWKLSRHGSGGGEMNGAFVLVVWGVEALLVLGAALFMVWNGTSEPYCERCNRWCVDQAIVLPAQGIGAAEGVFRGGDLAAFDSLPPPAEADSPTALKLSLSTCAGCKDTGFLSVEATAIEGTGKKKKEKKTELASHLTLRADQRARLAVLTAQASDPSTMETASG